MESPSYQCRSQAPSCKAASSASSRTGRRVASTTWWLPTTRQMGRPSYRENGHAISTVGAHRTLLASASTYSGVRALITHWAQARFDNVRFDHGVFQGCSETFSDPSTVPAAQRRTWDTNGGTLNSTAVGQNDIVGVSAVFDWRVSPVEHRVPRPA